MFTPLLLTSSLISLPPTLPFAHSALSTQIVFAVSPRSSHLLFPVHALFFRYLSSSLNFKTLLQYYLLRSSLTMLSKIEPMLFILPASLSAWNFSPWCLSPSILLFNLLVYFIFSFLLLEDKFQESGKFCPLFTVLSPVSKKFLEHKKYLIHIWEWVCFLSSHISYEGNTSLWTF